MPHRNKDQSIKSYWWILTADRVFSDRTFDMSQVDLCYRDNELRAKDTMWFLLHGRT